MSLDKKSLNKHYTTILQALQAGIYNENNVGLYTGLSGQILFLAQNYKVHQNPLTLKKIHILVDIAMRQVKLEKYINPSLSGGLSGFAWILHYLIQQEIVDPSANDVLGVFDKYISNQIKVEVRRDNKDLLNGGMGMCVYLMKRRKTKDAEYMVKHLDQSKIVIHNRLLWLTNKFNPGREPYYDFSLSHGLAGILFFLSKCYVLGILPHTCKRLIYGLIDTFKFHLQHDIKDQATFFPNAITQNQYNNGEFPYQKNRLAWCYGDLGVLYTLYNSCILMGMSSLASDLLKMIISTTKRTSDESTMVIDPWICHGASGCALLYNKLYLLTENIKLKEQAEFWINKTFDFGIVNNTGKLILNDSHDISSTPTRSFYSFLEGISGVGLACDIFLSKNIIDWDDCLMISY